MYMCTEILYWKFLKLQNSLPPFYDIIEIDYNIINTSFCMILHGFK